MQHLQSASPDGKHVKFLSAWEKYNYNVKSLKLFKNSEKIFVKCLVSTFL